MSTEQIAVVNRADAAAGGGLLERTRHLEALQDAFGLVRTGHGGVLVLIGGEAGGGKTTLLRRFSAETPGRCVLWGACDPLFTPRPLGPFVDIAQGIGGELRELVDAGAKAYEVATAIVNEAQARPGMIVVLEDLHWADEATLDVLSVLSRRIGTVPALVVVSYRDDELERSHPLRQFLGEVRGVSAIRRLTTEPLSVDAVRALAEPHGLDAAQLHRATAGNPFFVTEVLAAPSDAIPPTVRDAVLARAARLSEAATTVIEAVSIALPQAELWLLDALAADCARAVEQCLDSGILEVVPGGVAFRHDLARMAIEQSLSPYRRVALHRAALRTLAAPPVGPPDLARLAHHAEAAEDTAAVLRFAPAAAVYAASIGAHRESAAQYARALRFGDGLPAGDRAALLEGRSYECYLTDQTEEAIDALELAVAFRRQMGDRLGEGAALSQMSRRMWCRGRSADALRACWAALDILEPLPPGRELALAYTNLGLLALNDEKLDETELWSTRALEIAERIGDLDVIVHSLNNIGTMRMLAGVPGGAAKLAESLALAEDAGLQEHVGRAFIHLGWALTRTRSHELAEQLDRGVRICADRGLEIWKLYVQVYRARYRLDHGDWDGALVDATEVLGSIRSAPLLRVTALTILGLVRARRGDARPWVPLNEAQALLDGQPELQYGVPIATARAEAAWLDGRPDTVDADTRDMFDLARHKGVQWVAGELGWLRRLAGLDDPTTGTDTPYEAALARDHAAAADAWGKLGCPYDAALALVESDDEADLRRSLEAFQSLGARPAAAIVARRLRDLGARGLPRGPRAETRSNPANLTRRESEVLAHLREGASNAEIAARLFLSEKTVHHHVSAILRKLGARSRAQAAASATRLGL